MQGAFRARMMGALVRLGLLLMPVAFGPYSAPYLGPRFVMLLVSPNH